MTMPSESVNQGRPQRVTTVVDSASSRPTTAPETRIGSEVTPRLRDGRPNLGATRPRDREREHRVEEEARHGDRDDGQDDRDEDRAAEHVEGVALQHVDPEVRHRHPDPDRREELYEREAPVGHEQLESVEQQREGADREREWREHAPRAAQAEDRLLDPGLVALLDGAHERADTSRQGSQALLHECAAATGRAARAQRRRRSRARARPSVRIGRRAERPSPA